MLFLRFLFFSSVLYAQTAHLNHFYATVDAPTYAAIEASSFLRQQFAPFEKRTTVRNDSTYSGLYFYGQQTYFEFFEANTGDRKPGDAGLALGLEAAGGAKLLATKWQPLRPAETTMVTRLVNNTAADWFWMTSFGESRANSLVEGLRLFAMEYAPTFLGAWGFGPPGSILRQDILAAYCEKLGLLAQRKQSLLANVSHLTIAAPYPGILLRAQQLEKAGWKVTYAPKSIVCQGPQVTVHFETAPTPQGVRGAEFNLQHSYSGLTQTIGNSKLSFPSPRRAVWTFSTN